MVGAIIAHVTKIGFSGSDGSLALRAIEVYFPKLFTDLPVD